MKLFMERNDFLTLYNNIIRNNSVDMKTALETIREYCIIKGKEEEKINIFLDLLSQNPHLIMMYFDDSLKQLCYDFQVIILKDKNGNIILVY